MLGDGQISAIAALPQEDAATLQERDRKGAVYTSSNVIGGL